MNLNERPSLSLAIVDARAKRAMSQLDVVAKSEGRVGPGYLAMIEAGHRTPSREVLEAIADAIGLSRKEKADLLKLREETMPQRVERVVKRTAATTTAVSTRKLTAVAEKYARLSPAQRAAVDKVIDTFLE